MILGFITIGLVLCMVIGTNIGMVSHIKRLERELGELKEYTAKEATYNHRWFAILIKKANQ